MRDLSELAQYLLTCITPLVAQGALQPIDEHDERDESNEGTGSVTRALLRQSWAAMQRWLYGDAEAAAVLQLYQTKPDHPSYQHLLIEQVQTHLAHNETATAELIDLVRQWHQATGQQTSVDQVINAANIKDVEQQSTNYDHVKQQATATQDIVGLKQRAVRHQRSTRPTAPAIRPTPPMLSEQHAVDSRRLRQVMCRVYPRDRFELLCLDLGTSYDRLRGDTLETRIAYLIDDYRRSSRYDTLVQRVLRDYPHLREHLLSDA